MRILIVDDEARMAESIKDYFQPEGLESDLASNGGQARRLLEEKPYDALVSDLRMPGMDGMQLLRWVKDEGPEIPVIMISAHGDIRDAVEAMREGAYDYLVKPFDPDELLLKVRKAVENRRLRLAVLAGMAGKTKDEMIGESPAMREVDKILAKGHHEGVPHIVFFPFCIPEVVRYFEPDRYIDLVSGRMERNVVNRLLIDMRTGSREQEGKRKYG